MNQKSTTDNIIAGLKILARYRRTVGRHDWSARQLGEEARYNSEGVQVGSTGRDSGPA